MVNSYYYAALNLLKEASEKKQAQAIINLANIKNIVRSGTLIFPLPPDQIKEIMKIKLGSCITDDKIEEYVDELSFYKDEAEKLPSINDNFKEIDKIYFQDLTKIYAV